MRPACFVVAASATTEPLFGDHLFEEDSCYPFLDHSYL